MIMEQLSCLTVMPIYHPDCCASLSSTLISNILRFLPPRPSFTISIGSGTGLLEALILQARNEVHLEAVEVSGPKLNQYLPEDTAHVVAGTWDICPRASKAAVWMFVYPRETSLVRKYFDKLSNQSVNLLVWLGPKADYFAMSQIMPSFWALEMLDGCGSQYELLAVWRRISDELRPPIPRSNPSD